MPRQCGGGSGKTLTRKLSGYFGNATVPSDSLSACFHEGRGGIAEAASHPGTGLPDVTDAGPAGLVVRLVHAGMPRPALAALAAEGSGWSSGGGSFRRHRGHTGCRCAIRAGQATQAIVVLFHAGNPLGGGQKARYVTDSDITEVSSPWKFWQGIESAWRGHRSGRSRRSGVVAAENATGLLVHRLWPQAQAATVLLREQHAIHRRAAKQSRSSRRSEAA